MAQVIKADATESADGPRAVVLKLADFAAEARTIILEARKDAARILAEANAKAEKVLAEAAEKGYQKGFARGQNDGYADGQQQATGQAGQDFSAELAELVRKATREMAAARAGVPRQMLAFALELAEKIVGRVAATNVQAARTNLAKVLELAGGYDQVTLLVNPMQLTQLRSHCRQIVEAFAFRGEVNLVADEGVKPGGVKLVSGQGQIDATIATQLGTVVDALLPGDAGTYQPQGDATVVKCPPNTDAGADPAEPTDCPNVLL